MNEGFKEKNGTTPESLASQKYKEVQATMDEEDRIWKEVDAFFANTPDKTEAGKIFLEKFAPLMDAAMKKSREAFDAWQEAMKEPDEQ